MLICIVSDTHDHQEVIDRIVDYATRIKAGMIIHAGDWIAPFSLVRMAGFEGEVFGVYGNNDGERDFLREKANEVGVKLLGDFGEINVDGLKIAVVHGTLQKIVHALIKSNLYDIVISGHTHKPLIERGGRVIHVNPGEACGYLTGRRTIAVLNTEKLDVKIVDI